jgi:DNA-binding NarL/FixJ family response regulator
MVKAVKGMMTTVDEIMVRLFKAPHILVVQDTTAPVVGLLHRNYECQVDATDRGDKAVKLLMEQKYDLVILDIALLNGTSRRVLAVVQEYAPSTPVVVTCVQEIDFREIAKLGPFTLLSGLVTAEVIENLFRVFKIKARTREIAEYCAQRLGTSHAVIAAGVS